MAEDKLKSWYVGLDIHTRKVVTYKNIEDAERLSLRYQLIEAFNAWEAKEYWIELHQQEGEEL